MGGKHYITLAQHIYSNCVSFLVTDATTTPLVPIKFIKILVNSINNAKYILYIRDILQLGELIGSISGSSSSSGNNSNNSNSSNNSGNNLLSNSNINSSNTPNTTHTAPNSTNSTSIALGYELLTTVAVEMSNPTIRSELLYDLLHMGWSLVKYYWLKELPNLGNSNNNIGIGTTQSLPNSPITSNTPNTSNISNISNIPGSNVQHIVEFLNSIFVSCLSTPDIPPQDIYLCLDSVLYMGTERSLLSTSWFISNCRQDLLKSCITALLLNTHTMHHDTILNVLQIIINKSPENCNQYVQYIGESIIYPLCVEYKCEQLCMKLITQYNEITNNTNNTPNNTSNSTSNKLDMTQYTQYVIYTLMNHISTSNTCL